MIRIHQLNFKVLIVVFLFVVQNYAQAVDQKMELFDQARNRKIPVEIYRGMLKPLPKVIINHGYGARNTEYSFIANHLAKNGYEIISIQHDLESDPPLPRTGNLFERRKPLWERGLQNILFVLSKLDIHDKIILIGHSNGGDISMMFTEQHPELVAKVISLDSLRYPFPTSSSVPILALRANDTKPDNQISPQKGLTIISLQNAKHIDMSDRGPNKVKQEIVKLIADFLALR
jgi:pimeloyl-ACP methyl ester carboxylesterase